MLRSEDERDLTGQDLEVSRSRTFPESCMELRKAGAENLERGGFSEGFLGGNEGNPSFLVDSEHIFKNIFF